MRYRISIRDFVAGAVFGLVLGSVSLTAASIQYQGWSKLSNDFKVGYVTGFLSLAGLARNLEPGGWVDTKYPLVPKATPLEWTAAVDKLYQNPEFQRYSIHSALQAAASELQKTHGKPVDPALRAKDRMLLQLSRAQKAKEARAAKAGQLPGSGPDGKKPGQKIVEAPEKAVSAAPRAPKPRKWCRCDGKDPKAERARRRAEAAKKAEAEKAQGGAAPKAAPAPAAK